MTDKLAEKLAGGNKYVAALAPRSQSSNPLRRYAFLIGATIVFLLALFLIWQTWLVYVERDATMRLEQSRHSAAQTLAKIFSDTSARLEQAVAADAVTAPLAASGEAGYAEAANAVRQQLPELTRVDFYRSDIRDVITADFAKFGYVRSALLLLATSSGTITAAQTQAVGGSDRELVYALPVKRGEAITAYVFAAQPFHEVLESFRKWQPELGGLTLHQRNSTTDYVLASIGTGYETTTDRSEEIPNTKFYVGSSPPALPIYLPSNLAFLIPLTFLVLLLGITLFYARMVGWRTASERMLRRRKQQQDDTPLSQLTSATAQPPAAVPAVKPAGSRIAKSAESSEPAAAITQTISVERSIFRAYDIRGIVGKTLNADVARLIGQAIGSEMKSRGLAAIAVGRDGRLSGLELVTALIEGLCSTGADVTDIGVVPTPVSYFAAHHLGSGSAISLTGSHNPPDYNGLKIVLGGETLSGVAIEKLYSRIVEREFSAGQGRVIERDVTDAYIERIASDVQLQRKLKIVVDCGNGVAGAIAPKLFEAIGAEVVPLYCEVDGRFPNHHPDPSDLQNLRDLIMTVKQFKADLGFAFDGDGDRLGVVTAKGEVIFPDRLLMLFAQDVLSRNPGATIIYDVKCTGKLQSLILQAAGSPIMWRTGHSLIKAKMRETDAALAGEFSGHFFFKERWYGFDDGLYAGARLLEILTSDIDTRSAQEIFDGLPNSVSTPELKVEMREGEHYAFMERFAKAAQFEGARLNTTDGVRADWPDGFGLVRPSNTTPILVLRFEADSAEALRRIQENFRSELLRTDPALKLPF